MLRFEPFLDCCAGSLSSPTSLSLHPGTFPKCVCVCMFAPFFLFAVIAGGFWGGVERYVFILSYILTGHLPDRLREHAQRSPFFPVHTQECTRKNTVESVACIEKI